MRNRWPRTLGWVALVVLLGGCCADPCDPLCPGDPCDPTVGPCDPCACRTSHRARLVPTTCCWWQGCPDPCNDAALGTDPCYRDPATGIGDTPVTLPGVPTPPVAVPRVTSSAP